jgi:putative ABC transport system permease protein
MLKNYFRIAIRNLRRYKIYAIINVAGLSLGICCGILIFTILTYHFGFDDFHNGSNRIFRVVCNYHYAEGTEHQQGVEQPFGKAFRADYPFAEKVARVYFMRNALITLPGEKQANKFNEEKGIAFAEPEFLEIFNFPLLEGDKATVLTQPNSAIITMEVAKKYFGSADAIGQVIRYRLLATNIDFKITGILKDLPANTDLRQEIYLSYSNIKDGDPKFASEANWSTVHSSMQCFVLLKPGVSKTSVEKVLPQFAKKYLDPEEARITEYKLQPLSDIHFNTDYDGYTDKKYLWALGLVGIFLIITACVNFVNLATAQVLNRAKEVGIRKVMGSLRSQLFWQFIAETALIVLFALLFALVLARFSISYLNNLFETKMAIASVTSIGFSLFLLILILIVIFLSGFYPGLILTRFQPVAVLKGKMASENTNGFSLRKLLVVSQFSISQILIICTIVIASQVSYSKNADLGFNKDAIVMLPVPATDSVGRTKMQTLKNRLQQVAGTKEITFCSEAPASESIHSTDIRFANRPNPEPFEVSVKLGDYQYLSTFGIRLAAGRNIFPSDTLREYLVNETLVKKLGLKRPEDILNKNIEVGGKAAPVIGVMKDFYDQSFHQEKSPICVLPLYKSYTNCAIKIDMQNAKTTLAAFEKIWNESYPDFLYSYQFLDHRIDKFYKLDNIMLRLIGIFASIAIFIGCLGLYGLVSFMALQKTKEIGMRKVLGANVQSILWLFGKEFLRLLILAFLIAAPVAWWVMTKYLEDFKYRIQIGFGIFFMAVLITIFIAAITVAYRSVKAARTNPVINLRSE